MKHIKEDWALSKILDGEEGGRAASAPPELAREAVRLAALRHDLEQLGHEKPPADLNAAIMKRVHEAKPRHWLYLFLFRPRLVLLRTSVASAVTAAAILFLVGAVIVRFLVPPPSDDAGEPGTASVEGTTVLPEKEAALCPGGADEEPLVEAAKRSVRFSVVLPNASKVRLIGDFNAWSEKGIALDGPEDDGSWSVDLDLEPGKYQYMFVVDDSEWVADENADTWVDDGFGHVNSVRYIM